MAHLLRTDPLTKMDPVWRNAFKEACENWSKAERAINEAVPIVTAVCSKATATTFGGFAGLEGRIGNSMLMEDIRFYIEQFDALSAYHAALVRAFQVELGTNEQENAKQP